MRCPRRLQRLDNSRENLDALRSCEVPKDYGSNGEIFIPQPRLNRGSCDRTMTDQADSARDNLVGGRN